MINARTSRVPLPLRWWLASAVGFALLLTAALLRPLLDPAVPGAAPSVSAPPTALSGASPSASPRPITPVPKAVAVPKEPVALPAWGSGAFGYAEGRSRILGTKGPLRRFRVAVERGSGADVTAFAAQVEATLGDRRSWTGGGRLRLQRVSGAERAQFTIYLATRETAGRMCARGGVNIRVGGRPYTSCRATGRVIINLDRWRLSARPYLAAKVPLATYRHYVINHEVGHELGHGHQGCGRRGGPAPVMVQQTLTLRGCKPYAWPRRADRELVGPTL